MTRPRTSFAVTAILLGAIGVAAAEDAGETIRGITISTHLDGRDWAWDAMVPTLTKVRELGANWVTIHPYAAISADGRVRFRPLVPDDPPAHITRPIAEAHARGMKILIKPHLAYWGSPFAWRGEIEFEGADSWRRFWDSYRTWIVAVAAAARDADGFAVGTELDRTLEQSDEWRRIIAEVRAVSPAPLTYAANWSDYQRVPFWDALDAIGIQAYFPLTEETSPTEASIREGWQVWMRRLRTFSEEQERPIVFTELGYDRSVLAPVRPWEAGAEESSTLQRQCMRAALEAIEREPSVIGAFLWKWFPEPHPVGRNFQLATPAMQSLIREIWTGGAVSRH